MARNVSNIRNSVNRRNVSNSRGYGSEYISGSAVRKLAVPSNYEMPNRAPRKQEPVRRQLTEEERAKRRAEKLKLRKENKANFMFTVAMVAAVAVVFVLLINCISLNAAVNNKTAAYAQLKQQLSLQTADNDALEHDINGSVDFNNILYTAVKELGMVYPVSTQVITYEAEESQYIKQYGEIPVAR